MKQPAVKQIEASQKGPVSKPEVQPPTNPSRKRIRRRRLTGW